MMRRLHIGFFDDEHHLLEAARECRERGIPVLDAISPFPVHGIDEALGIKPSRLPWVTLAGGAVGATLGLLLQYWTAGVNWPLNIGGKPLDSFPAFVPVAFELTILFAGLATAGALFLRSGIWPGRNPKPGFEVTTDGSHALILEERDASFEPGEYRELLLRHGAELSEERVEVIS
jgi:ActD protein